MPGSSQDLAWQHQHDIVPIEVATGLRLDITRLDLGHPSEPDLWERLYRHCVVGSLICDDCAETEPRRYLYLQVKDGHRRVCIYGIERVAAAGLAESDEHRALKDMVTDLAVRSGLTAVQESRGRDGGRVTDVMVTGGTRPVGWEIQLSPIQPDHLRRRITKAVQDGVAPSWLSMRDRAAWRTLVDRAPATTLKAMSHEEIIFAGDPKIMLGIKRVHLTECTGHHKIERWHRGIRCTGWHGAPLPLEPDRHPTLGRVVELSAAGDLVPFHWPRNRRPWLLVPAADVERFRDAEPDFAADDHRPRRGTDLTDVIGVGSTSWHTATTKAPAADDLTGGITRATVLEILGTPCLLCGWTRGNHRPRCVAP